MQYQVYDMIIIIFCLVLFYFVLAIRHCEAVSLNVDHSETKIFPEKKERKKKGNLTEAKKPRHVLPLYRDILCEHPPGHPNSFGEK